MSRSSCWFIAVIWNSYSEVGHCAQSANDDLRAHFSRKLDCQIFESADFNFGNLRAHAGFFAGILILDVPPARTTAPLPLLDRHPYQQACRQCFHCTTDDIQVSVGRRIKCAGSRGPLSAVLLFPSGGNTAAARPCTKKTAFCQSAAGGSSESRSRGASLSAGLPAAQRKQRVHPPAVRKIVTPCAASAMRIWATGTRIS